jgi:hypothetical protein
MNINSISKELVRGSVISIMETHRPIIESFTDGEKIITFAFLNGVPIPYEIFALFMAIRFAPKCSESMLKKNYMNGQFYIEPEERIKLLELWSKCELPTELSSPDVMQNQLSEPSALICGLINKLYSKHMVGEWVIDDDSAKASFKELIHRIDEDYASSLINPIRI